MRHSTTDVYKDNKLIIFGTGSNAEMAVNYFRYESNYEIAAITVEQKMLKGPMVYKGYIVYPFEEITHHFNPKKYKMFIAVGNNHLRRRLVEKADIKGYQLVSFISPYAYIGKDVIIGRNCFIQEHNNLQYGVTIGDNTWLWASNHVGHNTTIGRHCFLASGIAISGYCNIGDYTFIGTGASTKDNIKIGKNCLIGVSCRVLTDIPDNKKFTTLVNYANELPHLTEMEQDL